MLGGCAPRGEYVTFTGFQQGTTYSIIVRDPAPDTAARIDSVFRTIDLTLSMFNPSSLVSRINRGETDRVTPLFEECFALAKRIHADTEGLYDPTVKPIVDAWGFGAGEMQRHPNLDSLMTFVGLDKIWLAESESDKIWLTESGRGAESDNRGSGDIRGGDVSVGGTRAEGSGAGVGRRIVKADPRVQLDFSSIAKGFTVDKMAEMLAQRSGRSARGRNIWRSGRKSNDGSDGGGEADFLVEIGGEIRAQGVNRQGLPWRVQIDRPEGGFAHQQAAVITLGGRNGRNNQNIRNDRNDRDANAKSPTPSPARQLSERSEKSVRAKPRNADGGSSKGGIGVERAKSLPQTGTTGSGSPKSDRRAGNGRNAGENTESASQLSAVATSGNYRNRFVDEDGATRVHTVDPRTGTQAAGEILSASVVSESCALADGWATALIAASDLVTARRLLANAAQRSDTSQIADDRQGSGAEKRSGVGKCSGGERSGVGKCSGGERSGVGKFEWYIISERGTEHSAGFPLEK